MNLVSLYFHPEPTGSAPPISDLALWLSEQGERIQVITARPSYPDRIVFDGYRKGEHDRETWCDIDILRLPATTTRSDGIIGRFVTEGAFALRLLIARLSGKVDRSDHVISVCPSIFSTVFAGMFSTPNGRHVAIIHDIQSGLGERVSGASTLMPLLRLLERVTFNQVDAIIALSSGMEQTLLSLGVKTPIHILPPQLDTRKITPKEEPSGTPMVIYSGALGRKQGLHQVLDAAAVLRSRGSPVTILIRGQGGIERSLRQRVVDEELDNVIFAPLAFAERLSDAMGDGIAHLVPQLPDGSDFAVPSKVFSIMSAGRPFIATAEPGSPLHNLAEDSGGGLCTPPNDAEGLADAIESIVADPEKRLSMGSAGRAYVVANVDRDVVCSRILSIIRGGDGAKSITNNMQG